MLNNEINKKNSQSVVVNNGKKSIQNGINIEKLKPEGGWGWIVVFSTFMVNLLTSGITYSFGVYDKHFQDYFEINKQTTAWIVSIHVGVLNCSGILISLLVDKFGIRPVAIFGSVISAISMAAASFSTNVYALYLTIGVGVGFGFGIIYLTSMVILAQYFDKRLALVTGIAISGAGLGTFFFPPLIKIAIAKYDWQGSLIILGIVIAVSIFCGVTYRPILPTITTNFKENLKYNNAEMKDLNTNKSPKVSVIYQPNDVNNKKESEKKSGEKRNSILETIERCRKSLSTIEKNIIKNESSKTNVSIISILKDPVIVMFSILNFFTYLGYNVPYRYVQEVAEENAGENELNVWLISTMGISSTVGRLIVGALANWNMNFLLHYYAICIILFGLASAFSFFYHTFWIFFIYSIINGFMSGGYVTLKPVCLTKFSGTERLSKAFAVFLMLQGFASFIGMPIAGGLYDLTQSFDIPFAFSGSVVMFSGIGVFFIPLLQRFISIKNAELTKA